MTTYNDARILTAEDLKKVTETDSNPTVGRLMFVELMTGDGSPGRIFPCFIEAWRRDDSHRIPDRPDGRPWMLFRCAVVQAKDGACGVLQVTIHEAELNVRKRFWDKPPAHNLMKNQAANGLLQ